MSKSARKRRPVRKQARPPKERRGWPETRKKMNHLIVLLVIAIFAVIRRLVLLALLVMIYLGWLVEAHPTICDCLVSLSQPLLDKPDFLSYRVCWAA